MQAPSLPSWERGLKFVVLAVSHPIKAVAPLVGAWIEIKVLRSHIGVGRVAPLVGAWIEILDRGFNVLPERVAPLVGAWIEISFSTSVFGSKTLSLPSWERGLKYAVILGYCVVVTSLPSWERGLKSLFL